MEQFEIEHLSINVTTTNIIFYLLVAIAIVILIIRFFINSPSYYSTVVGNWWTVLNESIYRLLLEMTTDYIGGKTNNDNDDSTTNLAGLIYFTPIYSIFILVLFSNLLGLIPYSSTPTVEIVVTLALAFTLLVGVFYVGFLQHRFSLLAGTPLGLLPLMILLELLAYCTRTLSLGLRLAVNMITGHILAKVSVGFIWVAVYNIDINNNSLVMILPALIAIAFPMLLLLAFLSLEILIAYLQAYIFTFITSITIKDLLK